MTLIVYKNGILAADTGCTRNSSRERYHKLSVLRSSNWRMAVAYAGKTDALTKYHRMLVQAIESTSLGEVIDNMTTAPCGMVLDAMDVSGLVVVHSLTNNSTQVYRFNQFANATGRGVWELVNDTFDCDGADEAVLSAIAVNAARPAWTADRIIKCVAEVNSSCDTKYGIDVYDIKDDVIRTKHG